jgi:hypothetical protein
MIADRITLSLADPLIAQLDAGLPEKVPKNKVLERLAL